MSLIILPLFSVIYLAGILMIISLKDILFNLLLASIKCKINISCNLDDFKKYSNFYDSFLKEELKEPIDFKIIMFWNIIGLKCLDSFGFNLTVLILVPFYLIILSLIYIFDFQKYDNENNEYSYLRLISLFFLWLGASIIIGSGTSISHITLAKYYPIIIDNCCCFKNKKNKFDKENKEEEPQNENIVLKEVYEAPFEYEKINEKAEEEENKINEINELPFSNDEIENENNEENYNYFLKKLKKKIRNEMNRIDIIKEEKIANIKLIISNELNKFCNKNANKKNEKKSI